MSTLKPGLNDCTNEEYHGDRTHYSSSALKLLLKDKEAFYRKYILNEKVKEEINHNFVFGSFVHALILEPHLVHEEFVMYNGSKNTAAFKEFEKANKGKSILTQTAWGNGEYLQQQVMSSSHAHLVQGGIAEQTFCGKIKGVPIKVRSDYQKDDYILDVKTTSLGIVDAKGNPDLRNIEKACQNYGYALSASLYLDMFKKAEKSLKRFLFMFVNKQRGDVVIVEASKEFLEYGRQQYLEAIDIFKDAKKNDTWTDSFPLIFPKF